jgi:hypothetical protein
MEHFLVATISKVHFEVMEQPNPNRVATTDMECRCNGPLLAIFRESRQALIYLFILFLRQRRPSPKDMWTKKDKRNQLPALGR